MQYRTIPAAIGGYGMRTHGMIVRTVKNARNGSRRPPRSLIFPRTGLTRALSPTAAADATPSQRFPALSPMPCVSRRPIAFEMTAKLKIVFAKS